MSWKRISLIFLFFTCLYGSGSSQPFTCDGRLILTGVSSVTTTYGIKFGSFGSVNYSPISVYVGESFDAVGFNPKDNYIYGVQKSTNSIVRLKADGSYEMIGAVPLIDSLRAFAGDCTPEGLYLCHENTLDKILVFNVVDNFELVREVDLFWNPTSGNTGPFKTQLDDFAIDPNNPTMAYAMQATYPTVNFEPAATQGYLLKINLDFSGPNLGMVTPIAPITSNLVLELGSIFFTESGQLFGFGPYSTNPFIANRLISINKNTGAAIAQGITTPVANTSDGCSCPYSLSFQNDMNPRIVKCTDTNLQFKLTIRNGSSETITNATLTDTFPTGIRIKTVPNNFIGNIETGTGVGTNILTIHNLVVPPKETVVITINTEVLDLPVGIIYNQAFLTNLPPIFSRSMASDDASTPDFVGDPSGFSAKALPLEPVKLDVFPPSDCINANDGKVLVSSPLLPPGNDFRVKLINQNWEEFNYAVQINNNNLFSIDSLLPSEYKLVQVTPISSKCGFTWKEETILVEPPNEQLKVNVGTNSPICEGFSLELNTEIFPDGTVSWTGPNRFASTEFNPTIDSTSSEYTGSFEMVATYGYCEQSRSIEILVAPDIEASIAGSLEYCERELISLEATGKGDLKEFTWSGPQNFRSDRQWMQINSMTPANQGKYEVIIDNGFCADTAFANIEMLPSPTINLPGLIETDFCTPLKLRPIITGDPDVTYSWTRKEGLDCYNCSNPTLEIPFLPSYRLTVLNSHACADTTVVQISLLKDQLLYVPNAFSPNFDGINDYFQMFPNCGVVKIKDLEIFNRWGAIVFSKKEINHLDPREFWDGKTGAKMNPVGVYIWQAKIELVDGTQLGLFGDISLLR